MFCEKCGKQISEKEKFCAHCGHPVQVGQKTVVTSSPLQKEGFFQDYRLQNIDLVTAEKHIKNAWVAALVSAGFTALFIVLGVVEAWYWADVGLILLFALGIYRKNKVAAIGMFVYFIVSKLVQIGEAEGFNLAAVLVAMAFLVYFYLGMMATIRYQRLVPKEHRRRGMVFGVVIGSLATLFMIFLLIGLLPEDSAPEDIVLQADYQEGYKAGYVDGRASEATLGDSYVQIATEERRGAYDLGYLAGFKDGCNEGGFDCSEVEQAINEALVDTELPSGSGVQLIPNSI